MRATLAAAALISTCSAGCGDLPGAVVGTYRITMKLEDNACGSHAVFSLDGHQYSAELRSEGKHGYWRVPGQTPLRGSYEAPDFHFEYASLVAQSAADAGAGTPYCRLLQSEVLTGSVVLDRAPADSADEQAPSDLTGDHQLTISAEPGDDCTSALAPEGAFDKLPCVVHYSLRGKHIKGF